MHVPRNKALKCHQVTHLFVKIFQNIYYFVYRKFYAKASLKLTNSFIIALPLFFVVLPPSVPHSVPYNLSVPRQPGWQVATFS